MPGDNLKPNQRMRPGVKALIVHQGKILMIHEKVVRNGNFVEIIDFPGGGIEFGESLQDALIREVREEVGLNIVVERVIGAWDFVLGEKEHDYQSEEVHLVSIGYQCSLIGEPEIDVDHNPAEEDIFSAKWYTREEILENKEVMLGNEGMVETVKNLTIS